MKRILFTSVVLWLAACSTNTGSSVTDEKKDSSVVLMHDKEARESRNKMMVMDIIDAFNTQELHAAFKDYSPDVIDYFDGSRPPLKGFDSVKKVNRQFFESFSNIKSENVHIVADGDWVMVWAQWSGSWTKDFAGQKATGKTFHIQDAGIFRFSNDGKIVEHHAIQPFTALANQIGMKMPK